MFFRFFMLWMCCGAVYAEDVVTSQTVNPPIRHGMASYYHATGKGQCSFDASPKDLMVAAVNRKDYNKAALCGAYLRVKGSKGEVVVRVVDSCPGCKLGGLDLSKQAFAKLADLKKGREKISWQIVSAPFVTPLQYRFKKGSNAHWVGVQVLNHRNPITKLEFLQSDGMWVALSRMAHNYFVPKKIKMGAGPYTFRVADYYGNILIDQNIPLKSGKVIAGAQQFAAPDVVTPE